MTNPKQPQQQPKASNFQDKLAAALMAGGIGGGGIGVFWAALVKDDIPKAIASAVIGLGITYSASFLKPIDQGNRRRLGNVGQAVDDAIEDGLDRLFATATKAEDAYLACQALDCRDYKSEGMGKRDRIMTPMLQEVFVPLELDSSRIPAGLKFDAQSYEALQRQGIWYYLQQIRQEATWRQMAIIAWGGYGKTTLLKHLAYIYGSKCHKRFGVEQLIPVLLPLRQYRELLSQDNPPDLPTLVMEHHVKQLAELDVEKKRVNNLPDDWFLRVLNQGRALVMMDGFDEVPEAERPALSRWISRQMLRFEKSVFILTSRPSAYKEDFAEPLRTKLWVRPLTAKLQTDFVTQWYSCQERLDRDGRSGPEVERESKRNAENLLRQIHDPQRPELADLAKNPLLLNLLATYHRSAPGVDLPRQRAELYQDICQLQLRKRPVARNIPMLLSADERQKVLQQLALRMMKAEKRLLDEVEMLHWIEEALTERKNEGVSAKAFLKQIIEVSELIVRQGLEGCEFSHLSFQEYLAAKQLKKLKQEAFLYPLLKDANATNEGNQPWWRDTILLYAAQINPTPLIKEALRQGASDLAYRCYQETQSMLNPEVEAELKALKPQLQTSRYSNLRHLLHTQKWIEADIETYRLMVETVGKEDEQWLDAQDFETFPCDELQIIDELWIKYSQIYGKKFGFTVQKEIWEKCGKPACAQDYEGWQDMCKQLGWRSDEQWLAAREKLLLQSSGCLPLSIPKTHYNTADLSIWFNFSALADRLSKCNEISD